MAHETIAEFLRRNGVSFQLYRLSGSEAATVESAARSIGCDPAMIVKNVVFVGSVGPVVVLCSGDRSVDRSKLSQVLGERVRLATREEVERLTGYAAGGVPPFCHREGVRVLADTGVTRFEEVVTSGGSSDTLIRLRTDDLIRLSGAAVHDVSKAP
ncbi:MAG: YbaK/EbsC family protein [Thaumarchaeota archaeon]|nr:YbaK/EbsC family protein [Candidatus Calditenuaceae archaeon]MCX8203465.1 YbaK/EbsC family protein [Nitrososphaeria archaeon]MDW8043945.1 YbaK/EbsC family protein [Nitrososphaerota archaeon]